MTGRGMMLSASTIICVPKKMEYIDFFNFCKQDEVYYKEKKLNLYIPEEIKKNTYPPSCEASHKYRHLKVIEHVKAYNPKRILEIGCGGGHTAAILYALGFNNILINDLRIFPPLAKRIRQWKMHENAPKFIQGNFYDIDPESLGRFDFIIASEVIEHFANPDQFLIHLKKFTNVNGRIVLTTPNADYVRNRIPKYSTITNFKALEKRQFKPDADGHLFLFSESEIKNFFIKHNLSVEKIDLFNSPLITGKIKLNILKSEYVTRSMFLLENIISQNIFFSKRLCNNLLIVGKTR
jgi:2-polyprenyl-3-methyl-5-hydroxy-6-metoxy-1,4-benzoquinol methylase